MAKRGEVLVARRRLGFGAEGKREHFLVLQCDLLAPLDTVVVAPLDDDAPMYQKDPLVVPCPAREAGTRKAQVVLTHLLSAFLLDRFEATPSGKVSAGTMARVDDALRTVLQV
jgi:mRNA-degrading endonuclease toxin of MazEF toxin-antitoxin module